MAGMHGQPDISYVLTLGTSPPAPRILIYVLNLDSIRSVFSDCWISTRLIVAYPPYIPYNKMFLGGPLDLPLVPPISGSVKWDTHGYPNNTVKKSSKIPCLIIIFPYFLVWPSNQGPHKRTKQTKPARFGTAISHKRIPGWPAGGMHEHGW